MFAAEQRGEQRGEQRTERRSIREFWETRFGPMTAKQQGLLEQVQDVARLQRMRLALYRADSLEQALASLAPG